MTHCFPGQPKEDLADEEEGAGERADLPDVQVDPTSQSNFFWSFFLLF